MRGIRPRIFMALFVVAGCRAQIDSGDDRPASNLDKASNEVQGFVAQARRYERDRLALTREGQGCAGKVLRDRELYNVIADKVDKGPPVDHPSHDVYRSNGRLERQRYPYGPTIGKYWIDGDQLCHQLPHDIADEEWCYRLINDNRSIQKEIFNPVGTKLSCITITLLDASDD